MTLGNGLPWQAEFDANYRLTRLSAGTVQDQTYTHDLRDNITAITDAIHSARSQTFGLDALSRLTSGAGAYGALSWTYDGVGNRQTETRNSATDSYSYPATSHRLQGVSGATLVSFGYDAAGNTTQKGDWVLQYNSAQRLSRVERTGPLGATRIAEATYNAQGQRVTKTLYRPAAAGQSGEPVTVVFHYDAGGHLLAETCADGRLVAEYAYLDDVPLALWRRPKDLLAQAGGEVVHECQLDAGVLPPTSLYYFHTDHLGTPQKLTDASGQIAWDAIYEPFGGVTLATEEVTQPLRYPGQYYDAETGVHQNWWRDYDPTLGRYLQSDPIGLDGGLNTYAYVDGNPLAYVDPEGLAKKYETPPNPNKRPPPPHRQLGGDRERNVRHPDAEEHSIKPKGPRGPRGGRGARVGADPFTIWNLMQMYCEEEPWDPACRLFPPPDGGDACGA